MTDSKVFALGEIAERDRSYDLVILKSIRADDGDRAGNDYVGRSCLQTRAEEKVRGNIRHLVVLPLDLGLLIENIVYCGEVGVFVAYGEGRECVAGSEYVKCTAFDRHVFDSRGKRYLGETAAACKCAFTDLCNTLGDDDFGDLRAGHECLFTYAYETHRKLNALKCAAALECRFVYLKRDSGLAIGCSDELDEFKCAATVERVDSDKPDI